MVDKIWLLVAILIILIAVGIFGVVIAMKKGKKHKPDYYALFVIGIIWLPIGVALDNSILWILGLAFLVVGLVNRKKWKENHKKWSKLNNKERKIKLFLMILLLLILIAGVVLMFLVQRGFF